MWKLSPGFHPTAQKKVGSVFSLELSVLSMFLKFYPQCLLIKLLHDFGKSSLPSKILYYLRKVSLLNTLHTSHFHKLNIIENLCSGEKSKTPGKENQTPTKVRMLEISFQAIPKIIFLLLSKGNAESSYLDYKRIAMNRMKA